MARRKADPASLAILPDPASVKPSWPVPAARQRVEQAYGVLADQPASLAGLAPGERAQVAVSAVRDDSGNTFVISRVGDLIWDLWPFLTTPNTPLSHKRLDWSCIPEPYREAVQNVLYAYWKQGRPGWALPGVPALIKNLGRLAVFCRAAAALRLASLADLQPLHVATFVAEQKSVGKALRTQWSTFSAVELLYLFRGEHECTLQFHPWPESSSADMAGFTGAQREGASKVGLTPLIPGDVSAVLFQHAEGILERTKQLLDERDRGERSSFRNSEIIAIRAACFYLLGVLTGMRSSELSSIEVGAGRTEVLSGFTFHWLTTTEHKTKKGVVDYLMPVMGLRILSAMERWSEPLRQRLAEQIVAMENKPGIRTTAELQWLTTARSNRNRLFLGISRRGIVPVSANAWGQILTQFARDAGTTWKLAPHQMRRLYAYTFVRHKLGDLLFLKEQFKHSSVDMSQLYAASPRQDRALYDDILSELLRYKGEVIAAWLEKDEPLSGGAGRKIMDLRAQDFPNRKALVVETSRRILMRSNGHAWCLAQDQGCGGSGIYERGRCGGCHNGLIDRRFLPIWQEAYQHHKELRAEAETWGLGAAKRVEEDMKQAARILKDLGIDPEQGAGDAQNVAG